MSQLGVIDSYCDAVPRSAASAEPVGPFTLFVNPGPGWRYYARPTPGELDFTPQQVLQICDRQSALGVPRAFEWVKEVTPTLYAAVKAAGCSIKEQPLLLLESREWQGVMAPDGTDVRLLEPEDDLALAGAVAAVAFSSPGIGIGTEGEEALRHAATQRATEDVDFERNRLAAGTTVMAAAFVSDLHVAVGSHNPVGSVSEIVGVATLPAFRRRRIA